MRTLTTLALTALLAATPAVAAAAATNGSAQLNYKVLPTVRATVVPNYQAGFGVTSTSGQGSGSTPATGASAVLDGGNVDFGTVVVGYQYLYKYAAQVSVQTNDTAGFVVYAEGATDFTGSNPAPLANTLFWLVSNSSNSAFSPASSFSRTAATPLGVNGSGGIDYSSVGGTPPSTSMIWSYPTSGSVTQGYDYQLRPSSALAVSQYNVYIVYTVVGN